MNPVRCTFYLRTPAKKGGYHYDRFLISSWHGDNDLVTRTPPSLGEKVALVHPKTRLLGSFGVVDCEWNYNAYGSVNWPRGESEPQMPDMMRFVVEECDSLFIDEADD